MDNLQNSPEISKEKDIQLTYHNLGNVSNNISVSPSLRDAVNKIIRKSIQENNLLSCKDYLNELWEVTVKPEFQKGIENGTLYIKAGKTEIRDKNSGQFVGKADLKQANTDELTKEGELSGLTNITNAIASIAGQAQMAEISRKLDVINEKVDQVGQHQWREKVSEVHSLNSVIKEAIESLPNKNAIQRINDSIIRLQHLAHFFEETIKELLGENIDYTLKNSFIEGLKFWGIRNENRYEYNNEYNRNIQDLINNYKFLLDLYFQIIGLIGTCYQVTNEYHHATKYFRKIEADISHYSGELVDKLIYLLNIEDASDNDQTSLSTLSGQLKHRKLPQTLIEEFNSSEVVINEIKRMHKILISQFEHVQLSYEVEPSMLMEVSEDD